MQLSCGPMAPLHAPFLCQSSSQRPPHSRLSVIAQAKKGAKQQQQRPRGRDARPIASPDGPARPTSVATQTLPPSLQGVNFDGIESVEVRGNQVILTMDESDGDTAPAEAQLEEEMHVMDAVVKIFCVHTEPNYSLPWQRKRQYSSTSSGFMVNGKNGEKLLLTNAHSVEYHSQVKVKVI